MKLLQTKICLDEMVFYAYHGVLPQECIVGTYYTLSLCLYVANIDKAIEKDDLSGTVNYAEVYHHVAKEMQQPSALLEHVAGRILESLFQHFVSVYKIRIKLSKKNPPIELAEIKSATIDLIAERS